MLRIVAAGTSISTPSENSSEVSFKSFRPLESDKGKLTSVVAKLKVADFVDDVRHERGVEEGPGFEPSEPRRQLVSVDQ